LIAAVAIALAGGPAFDSERVDGPYAVHRDGDVVQLRDARTQTAVPILPSVALCTSLYSPRAARFSPSMARALLGQSERLLI